MTTFAIIYSSKNDVRMHQMHMLLKEYEDIVRVSDGFWLIECDGNPVGIKYYLNKIVTESESLTIFEITKEWAFSGSQDVCKWLNNR